MTAGVCVSVSECGYECMCIAVVLQCGADSLTGDRLGCFNLTVAGHANCVEYIKSFGLPLLVLGGGGYTVRNVARCWAYETSVLLNAPIDNEIPFNDYFEYYAPDFKLHLTPSNMDNQNKPENLHNIVCKVLANLKNLQGAPSVQMHPVPPDAMLHRVTTASEMQENQPDVRHPSYTADGQGVRRQHEAEFHTSGNDVTTIFDINRTIKVSQGSGEEEVSVGLEMAGSSADAENKPMEM